MWSSGDQGEFFKSGEFEDRVNVFGLMFLISFPSAAGSYSHQGWIFACEVCLVCRSHGSEGYVHMNVGAQHFLE